MGARPFAPTVTRVLPRKTAPSPKPSGSAWSLAKNSMRSVVPAAPVTSPTSRVTPAALVALPSTG